MKNLPIGIQTFSKIREGNYYYVDKTPYIESIARRRGYYFLSRPRRFGKSLFLDTLGAAMAGQKELFKGLYLYERHDFTPHPVIRISFGSGDYGRLKVELATAFTMIFTANARDLKLPCPDTSQPKQALAELIYNAWEKYQAPVVILIDEYDKPILDNLSRPEAAREARDTLKNFYGVLKDSDRYIHLAFITGVSKFSKLNLFSGLNNIEDITVNPSYAEICGYTQADLETTFAEAMAGADMELVKRWYNGYAYLGEKVYNPFDILLFISNKLTLSNYWWQTGNPAFLIDLLKKGAYYLPQLEHSTVSEELLNAFDVDFIDIRALLWQTGYLTIQGVDTGKSGRRNFHLGVPNVEVQYSLNEFFLYYLTENRDITIQRGLPVERLLDKGDVEDLVRELKALFAGIPYTNYVNNLIAGCEGYWSSLIFVFLSSIGYKVICEDMTNLGRIDMTILTDHHIYIIEFKVDIGESPLAQIEERRYWEKYSSKGKTIHLVGLTFSGKEKNITRWETRKLEA